VQSLVRPAQGGGLKLLVHSPSRSAGSNARHHPRPHATYIRDFVKGRRVHAVVRRHLKVDYKGPNN
jgi:hypothetical protein